MEITLNLIEPLKTSMYNPKHTQNTKMHSQKIDVQINDRFMPTNMVSSILFRATPHN